MYQMSFFDGDEPLIIDAKPIRLIELFAGYGSQHLALKYLGLNVQSWRIAEWAVPSIQAYKDLHFEEDDTDYSQNLTKNEIEDFLFARGISSDYNQPMTLKQIQRRPEKVLRTIYNNIIATHNQVSVCNMHGEDLAIEDREHYNYILTYSFPCQDLSSAGQQKGMEKGSGTRSGLLWEVERLLDESLGGGKTVCRRFCLWRTCQKSSEKKTQKPSLNG